MASSTFRVLVMGDFHYGESYGNGGGRILREHGYEYSTQYMRPFFEACDKALINLETPLAKKETFLGSFDDSKPYVHWADPLPAAQALRELGVDAVSLANNHTVDLGSEALESTFRVLDTAGIAWFGAGEDEIRAEKPYQIDIPDRLGGGSLRFHGFFEYRRSYDERFGFYAGQERPGCAHLSRRYVPVPKTLSSPRDVLEIAFPHWGPNYVWRSKKQADIAHKLTEEGYDLVLGHGSHSLQEMHRVNGRWVAYSLGNGNFQSAGRWTKFQEENDILPYGLWGILEVSVDESGQRRVTVKLYPVYLDNRLTGYQPRPVEREDFEKLLNALPESFSLTGMSASRDSLGYFIELDVCTWPVGDSPESGDRHTRSELDLSSLTASEADEDPTLAESISDAFPDVVAQEPNTFEDDESQSLIREQEVDGRSIGTLVLARAAQQDGAEVRWYSTRTALFKKGSRRALVQAHMCTDTTVSAGIVKDKLLTKELLQEAGVATPSGALAKSAHDAVTIQERLGVPVVVKPRFGRGGRGITVDLSDSDEIFAAFRRAAAVDGRGVLVEELIDGLEFRVLATPERSVGAVRRLLPHVTGNGNSSIRELIESKNALRRRNPNNYRLMIPMDEITESFLKRHHLTLDDVLPDGQSVIVRNVGGVSGGGDAQECLDDIDDTIRDLATESIAAIPGMAWGGADILLSRRTGKPYILELNTSAAISNSTYPVYGTPKDVGKVAWNELLKKAYIDLSIDDHASPNQKPRAVSLATQSLRLTWKSPDSLRNMLKAYLRTRGFDLTFYALGVFRARNSHGTEAWFRGCADEDLPRPTTIMLQDHSIMRELLRDSDIAVPIAHPIGGKRDLDNIPSKTHTDSILVKRRNGWSDRKSGASIDWREARGGILQSRPKGRHLRVFASRQQMLAVLKGASSSAPSKRHIQQASRTAVESVRAVPGIRWAVVDVVVPAWLGSEPKVEGLDIAGNVSGSEVVVAGSLELVLATIAGARVSETLS